MFAPLLIVRSISDVTLELLGERADRAKADSTPFRVVERHPYGFVEIIRILSLDRRLQRLAHAEAVVR